MQKRVCGLVGNLCSDAFGKEFAECYSTVENFAEVAKEKDADFLLGHLAEIKKNGPVFHETGRRFRI